MMMSYLLQIAASSANSERLNTRPTEHDVPREGVFTYDIAPEASRKGVAAADDAMRIAAWIRDRIDLGWQRPLVRMRVQRADGDNSIWLPLFTGPKTGRVQRLLRGFVGA